MAKAWWLVGVVHSTTPWDQRVAVAERRDSTSCVLEVARSILVGYNLGRGQLLLIDPGVLKLG